MNEQAYYCAWAKDDGLRNISSSGGLFGVFAKRIIDSAGAVVGAAWIEDFSGVEHRIIEKKNELEILYQSKYVESHISKNIWDEIEQLLIKGKTILFSGTPCQVAICKSKYHSYGKQLITIDVLCHGAPDPEIWYAYKNMMEREKNAKLISVNHRKKDEYGWKQRAVQYCFDDMTSVFTSRQADSYIQLFLNNIILNEKCYNCKFSTLERKADITLGDFWSLKDDKSIAGVEKGLSLLIVNTGQGRKLFEKCIDEIEVIVSTKEQVLKNNIPLLNPPHKAKERDTFYKNYKLWGIDWALIKQNRFKNDIQQRLFNYSIFRNLFMLQLYEVNLSEIVNLLGIDRFYLYGYGDLGKYIRKAIDCSMIAGIIDKSFEKSGLDKTGISLISIEEIPCDNIPILVSPAFLFQDISFELIEKGVNRTRIISFETVLKIAIRYTKNSIITKLFSENSRLPAFLITGAQFANKGAQAMLFTVMSEIRRRYPEAVIYYLPVVNEEYNESFKERFKLEFIDYVFNLDSELMTIVPSLTAIVDVSGYVLKSDQDCKRYIKMLRIAKNYDIPMYILPQSFGPLIFPDYYQKIISQYMHTPKIIFAREKVGADLLRNTYSIDNIRESTDLVLQSTKFEWDSVLNIPRKLSDYIIEKNAIALIPNIRTIEYSSLEKVMNIYKLLLQNVLDRDVSVYIIPHSKDDYELCENICSFDARIKMPWHDLDCFEFEELIAKFKFVVASRYHSIVHSYRSYTPCVIIGWAEKYLEISKLMNQEKYYYDIRDDINVDALINSVMDMDENTENNRRIISENLLKVQNNNCFFWLDDMENL